MAKITLADITAGYNLTTTTNANNTLVEAAVENTLSRDGTSPNTMSAALDMNSNLVNNITDGTSNQDAVSLAQLTAATVVASSIAGTLVTLVDSGSHFTTDTAEGALQELGLRRIITAEKNATTVRTSVTTLANDPELFLTIPGAGTYVLECMFIPACTTAVTQGMKFNLNFTGGVSQSSLLMTGIANAVALTISQADVATSVTTGSFTLTDCSLTSIDMIQMKGYVECNATGTLGFSWAQDVSDSNATNVFSGAYLTAMKVS